MSNDISTLIPVRDHDGQQVASGRDLHAYLGIGTEYARWFARMVEYGFIDGQDFSPILTKTPEGGRPSTDHAVTFDMAKELGMIQRTPEGKRIRQYFIDVEKRSAAIEPSFEEKTLEVLSGLKQMVEAKDEQIAELSPKADAYESFMEADGTYSIGRVAKMLGRSQNKLFADLRNAGVLIAKGHMHNTPYQRYMHHFKVTPYSYERKDDTIGCSYTTTVQPSGVEFIRRKLGVPFVQRELEVVS